MLLALALAGAVAGGNLAVGTPAHRLVGLPAAITVTGEVGSPGRLFLYRNRGAPCGAGSDDERALGRRKALLLHPAVAVQGAFDYETTYVPPMFGVRETLCSYLYAEGSTGLPPDAGFSENNLTASFALPAGGRWSAPHGLTVTARGLRLVRVSGACAGFPWSIDDLRVDKRGRFAAFGLRGRFDRRVASVSGTCDGRGFRLARRRP